MRFGRVIFVCMLSVMSFMYCICDSANKAISWVLNQYSVHQSSHCFQEMTLIFKVHVAVSVVRSERALSADTGRRSQSSASGPSPQGEQWAATCLAEGHTWCTRRGSNREPSASKAEPTEPLCDAVTYHPVSVTTTAHFLYTYNNKSIHFYIPR